MVKGDDVRRWRIEEKDRWMIYIPHGTDIKRFPAIEAHLRPLKSQLEKRATKQEWFELQQPQLKFVDVYQGEKIIFPDIAKESRFALDKSHFPSNTCYCLGSSELYLLGVLNSSSVWEYARGNLTVLGDAEKGGRLRFFTQFVEKIPIPNASPADKSAIESLVEACLSKRGQNCEAEEAEINARVAALYGLD